MTIAQASRSKILWLYHKERCHFRDYVNREERRARLHCCEVLMWFDVFVWVDAIGVTQQHGAVMCLEVEVPNVAFGGRCQKMAVFSSHASIVISPSYWNSVSQCHEVFMTRCTKRTRSCQRQLSTLSDGFSQHLSWWVRLLLFVGVPTSPCTSVSSLFRRNACETIKGFLVVLNRVITKTLESGSGNEWNTTTTERSCTHQQIRSQKWPLRHC